MQMNTKYKLDYDNPVEKYGRTWYQIIATRAFTAGASHYKIDIKNGTHGGYVQNEHTLSHSGSCWIEEGCYIGAGVVVQDSATVLNKFILLTAIPATDAGAEPFSPSNINGHAYVCGPMRLELMHPQSLLLIQDHAWLATLPNAPSKIKDTPHKIEGNLILTGISILWSPISIEIPKHCRVVLHGTTNVEYPIIKLDGTTRYVDLNNIILTPSDHTQSHWVPLRGVPMITNSADVLNINNIGSRLAELAIVHTDSGPHICTGCFYGDLKTFRQCLLRNAKYETENIFGRRTLRKRGKLYYRAIKALVEYFEQRRQDYETKI